MKPDKPQKEIHPKEWGELVYSLSEKGAEIRWSIITSMGLFLSLLFSMGLLIGRWFIGLVGLAFSIPLLILLISGIKRYEYLHIDVYENGIWFPFPTFWFWQDDPSKERYFRSFDDIIDIEKKVTGSYHIFVKTQSEGEIHFAVYKSKGSKLMEEIEKAMFAYERDN